MANSLNHADFKDEVRQLWKDRIIRVAVQAFKKEGYHGTSMDDIARQLNITKGNLYYYFKNKEAILFDCHTACLDIAIGIIEEIKHTGLTPAERLHKWISLYMERMLQELVGSILLLTEEGLSPSALKLVIERRDYFEKSIREIVAEGMELGEFPPGDPKMLTFAILGSVNWTPKWYNPDGEKQPSEIAAIFADWIVRGILRKRPSLPEGLSPDKT